MPFLKVALLGFFIYNSNMRCFVMLNCFWWDWSTTLLICVIPTFFLCHLTSQNMIWIECFGVVQLKITIFYILGATSWLSRATGQLTSKGLCRKSKLRATSRLASWVRWWVLSQRAIDQSTTTYQSTGGLAESNQSTKPFFQSTSNPTKSNQSIAKVVTVDQLLGDSKYMLVSCFKLIKQPNMLPK